MKKILILMSITLGLQFFLQTSVYAQPRQGGRPGGGSRPTMGPPRGAMNRSEPDKLMIDYFPEIPNLSLEQQTDIGIILMQEQKEINKQMQKKQQLLEKMENPSINGKKRYKMQKNTDKIDQKVKQRIDKSNKKVKKILSNEQYRIFIAKRGEFRFRILPPMRFNGIPNERPQGDRPEGMGGRPGGRRP